MLETVTDTAVGLDVVELGAIEAVIGPIVGITEDVTPRNMEEVAPWSEEGNIPGEDDEAAGEGVAPTEVGVEGKMEDKEGEGQATIDRVSDSILLPRSASAEAERVSTKV